MKKIVSFLLSIFALAVFFNSKVYAAAPTDEILNYQIDVSINDDATMNLTYHIDWLVLDDEKLGPLDWVQIGIPNRNYVSYEPLSSTIDSMSVTNSNGTYMRIDLDRNYYEGDVASFDFILVQDNMYQVDKFEEGYTVYSFTPGWFDDIKVDNLTINWDSDKVTKFTPDCLVDGNMLSWETSLGDGDKFTVSVTYPNDAYGFDLSKAEVYEDDEETFYDWIMIIVGFVFIIGFLGAVFVLPIYIIYKIITSIAEYSNGAAFNSPQKKITRTKVTYYPSCPGCGAVRKDGEQVCAYCGRSLVKSEEIIKEETIKPEDRGALKFNKDGEYRYSSMPDTYIRVHTIAVPRPMPVRTSHSSGSSSRGSHHSSCAHSSCACACACACAGGGRAGCTNKDFYNTNLKLRQLEKRLSNGK